VARYEALARREAVSEQARDNAVAARTTGAHVAQLQAAVVAMAAFMEILDTSIANVALPHIAGNLGTSNDKSTWVLTSYLVANAIVLLITGRLAGAIGRMRFFAICLAAFIASSVLCGLTPLLAFLIVARIVQGAGGGGLQPIAQAILADSFAP
jgi:MFS transporter, DHA2 family, multidrug resistance protein